MPDKYRQGQALMVRLDSLGDQGISVWLEEDGPDPRYEEDTPGVREEISYMRECVFQSGELNES